MATAWPLGVETFDSVLNSGQEHGSLVLRKHMVIRVIIQVDDRYWLRPANASRIARSGLLALSVRDVIRHTRCGHWHFHAERGYGRYGNLVHLHLRSG